MTSGGPHLKAEKRMAGGLFGGLSRKKKGNKKEKDNEIKEEKPKNRIFATPKRRQLQKLNLKQLIPHTCFFYKEIKGTVQCLNFLLSATKTLKFLFLSFL